LRDGLIADSAVSEKKVRLRTDLLERLSLPAPEHGLTLTFTPDATVWDGAFANNAWLQELPKPMTQLTWDNALLISPALAAREGLSGGDRVEVRAGQQRLAAAVWVAPGQSDSVITLSLGYGRRQAGRIGNGCGFDAYQLRRGDALWAVSAVSLRRLPGRYELATTQTHHGMHGRAPVRRADLAEYLADPQRVVGSGEQHESLYPPYRYAGHAWAMFINLNTCIGCSACTIACQAENNIPVVGKEEVRRGREMHWIRVDRYYEGETHDPRTYFQPVPCMHCEHAPCELVCPVGATMHDGEGLNVQVYNRCIGTRFCSNNCPYKVRRFNFLQYADRTTEALAARRNPQVTVRRRGVMEKCTYCIQRIERARIRAEREDRALRDGEVLTACQQVCPTQAIVFGDLNDRKSALVQAKASPLNYVLLEELNTRPRTSYGARLRNPNADLSADNGENA
jgi:Fe-S-cluster-containing dehydrogenase component